MRPRAEVNLNCPVSCVRYFSPLGGFLISSFESKALWCVKDGNERQLLSTLSASTAPGIANFAVNSDHTYLSVAFVDGTGMIYRIKKSGGATSFLPHKSAKELIEGTTDPFDQSNREPIVYSAFLPGTSFLCLSLAVNEQHKTTLIYDLAKNRPLLSTYFAMMAVAGDLRYKAFFGVSPAQMDVLVYQARAKPPLVRFESPIPIGHRFSSIWCSPATGHLLLAGAMHITACVHLLDLATFETLYRFPASPFAEAPRLIKENRKKVERLRREMWQCFPFDVGDGDVATFDNCISSLDFRTVAVPLATGSFALFQPFEPKKEPSVMETPHKVPVASAAQTPDGDLACTGCLGGTLVLWKMPKPRPHPGSKSFSSDVLRKAMTGIQGEIQSTEHIREAIAGLMTSDTPT